jgi:oxygen-independent coproporphyrinogen-3 oxidase
VNTEELLRRYDRPGPRYTSYPTALEFHEGVDNAAYARALEHAAAQRAPLSFYLHLPFCEERCLFCGCNVVITKKREVARRYVDVLAREIREVARRLGARRRVSQYHWGGGTPTYLDPEQIRGLHRVFAAEFNLEPDAEMAVEADPRVTTAEHLRALREMGFNRLSFGVQDFAREVQREVKRVQSFEQTEALVAEARGLGFDSINLDLIYGLPRQTPQSFRKTLELVRRLRPERVAVYSYAHVPWLKGHQRRIRTELLPDPKTKLSLFASAISVLREAGYLSIGMDHFALPEDELGRGAANGTLGRNFMGYTVRSAPDLIACGLSGIGSVGGAFFQNRRKLHDYERAVEEDGLAVERGYVSTPEDRLRQYVISSLMCSFKLDFSELERRFGVRFSEAFARESQELEPLEADGLVRRVEAGLVVTDAGRLFVRNVCMVFDAHLSRSRDDAPRWSRTV